ncbi:MAG: TolC family protein [Rhizobiales bacterium]|nr:TolC family protein [Hyphomicrobiales bacterium]
MPIHTRIGVGWGVRRVMLAATLLLASACLEVAHAQTLTLNDALLRALKYDLTLPAARSRVRGAEAGVRQANKRLNPSVGADIENFGGSGQYGGFRSAQSTLYLQQTIELGGKREARTDVARSELGTVKARSTTRVLDMLREVEIAWIDAAAATAQLRLAEARLGIAQRLKDEIARRAQAGRDPLYVQARADAQVSLEQIAVDQARANVRIARTNVANYWRGRPDFDIDLTTFESTEIPAAGRFFNVDVAVAEAERDVAGARVVLERTKAIPDPSVRLGVRRFNDTNDTAIVGGISIPLPLFDRNEGNIERAEAERKAAELDLASVRRALRRELTRLQGRLLANATEARRIQSEAIPQAERSLQLIREGLERGAFNYVEFVDAQRTLNDARNRRIEALRAFNIDKAAVARLTGRHARLSNQRGSR